MSDQTAVVPSLTARIEERILAPLRRSAAARTWFFVTLAAILLLHIAVLLFLLHRDSNPTMPVAQETPIEVVVEKKEEPKPPAKAPEPPKPPQKQPEIEKPASSAPRAPSEIKVDTAKLDKETHAPKAAKPLADGRPEPAPESVSPVKEATQEEKVEEAETKPDDVLKKDAEALDKAVPQPKPRPKKLAKATPAKSHSMKTMLQQLAGTSPLPDYKFARPTKKTKVFGGNEDARYLAIVYGMIIQHRTRVSLPAGEAGSVTIAFNVDGEGNLTGMGVQHSSGFPEVDQAAASAIRRASPFPPPPAGAPHGLIATIDFGDAAAYTMGDRSE